MNRHVDEAIPVWLAGELDPQQAAAFERHLAECPECAKFARESRAVWAVLGAADPRPGLEAEDGSGAWRAVRARTVGGNSDRGRSYGSNALARTGLATAALAAGLFIAVIMPAGARRAATQATDQAQGPTLEETSWPMSSEDYDLDGLWLSAGLESEG